ncbi:MAG TPA: PIG-L deacetylase family protein [Nocardioidaceae bacterium]|nr:PIG-L deacetylase family protein [Nocardioidaceae bacterium]
MSTDDRLGLPDSDVSRVLVVSAHPDDVDFGVAGTVATWTDAGVAVTYCIITDGQAGGFDRTVPRDEMVLLRRKEQREAAARVGVEDVRFLGYVDGDLEPTKDLVGAIARLIREIRPQRMVVPSPERDYARIHRSHPDHLAAGKAALDAIYPAARNPFAHPELLAEGLEPWTVPDTWLMAHPTSNRAVDITATYERKIAAILAHASQHEDAAALVAPLREAFTANARVAGLPEGHQAEAFFVVPTA